MQTRLHRVLFMLLVIAGTRAAATPMYFDDEVISGELSSLALMHYVSIEAWPAAHGIGQPVLWISVADAGSWPACLFALTLLVRELCCVRALGRHTDGATRRSGVKTPWREEAPTG